jgi:hypothetical protein
MMRSRPFTAFLLTIATGLACAAKPHVHGAGTLDVVIDKAQVNLVLEIPLDAAVGFEHAPKDDKEKAALATADKALKDAATLFVPTPTAGCALQSAEVRIPFTGGMDRHDHAHEGEEHHADIDANYVFRCTNPAALKGIETTIFRNFKRLYRLEVQRAGPAGQGAARLSPNKPVLTW